MQNAAPYGDSDISASFGAEPSAQDTYEGRDAVHSPIGDPEHDVAWVFVADQGGNGGWNQQTGQYEEYPHPGLLKDMFAPFGAGTEDPARLLKTWAAQLHAPNTGYTWWLIWEINYLDPEWWIPGPPFAIRILPNETFPDGLDLTAQGAGRFVIKDLPQWGPEPRIWLIEAGIVPEPGLTFLAAALPLVAIALRRRR
jgi:hypothetical protein